MPYRSALRGDWSTYPYRGDFLGVLGKVGRAVAGGAARAVGMLPGVRVAQAVYGGVGSAARAITGSRPSATSIGRPSGLVAMPGGGVIGGKPGSPSTIKKKLGIPTKRRRMNYGNVKALRRADRRIDGFVKVARSALKHTNYKVVSKSAGRARGSSGVITRAEARRALAR